MSKLNIIQAHDLSIDQALALADKWMRQGAERFQLKTECSAASKDCAARSYRFSRTGLQGELQVNGANFTLNLELGFLLSPFREQIEATVRKNLARDLA